MRDRFETTSTSTSRSAAAAPGATTPDAGGTTSFLAARPGAVPLSIDSLRVSYRAGSTRHVALDSLSFSIGAGQAYGLVGESGSGKSTVAMAIARYLAREARIEAGRIELAGHDIHALGGRALRDLRRNALALVYQDPARALNPTITVGVQIAEAVELATLRGSPGAFDDERIGSLHARTRASSASVRARVLELLERVRMPSAARAAASYPHELSGGMQQRAVIAMALAKSPALLILDEATTGLDATVEADIIMLIDSLRRESGTALLFISHKLPLVAGLCDCVGILENGRLVEQGEPARLFDRPEHPYTAALLACIPTLGRTRRDGPLATLDDARGIAASPPVSPASRSDLGPRASRRALEVRGVSKRYRVGGVTVCALDHIDLELRAGETLGLVGESGSGKTTLARAIAGLVEPDAGDLLLDGAPLAARVEHRTRAHIAALQSVFQNPQSALNRAHRLRTLLGRAVTKLAGLRGAAREQRVRTLLDAVRLPHERLGARARELSGGQQQRVAIARAFAGEPRIVICDEPTSALDVSVQASILNVLVELQRTQNVSYLFISHDLAVVRYVADRVAVLYRGQIVESGPADQLFDHPRHPYTIALLSAAARIDATRRSVAPRAPANGGGASDPLTAPLDRANDIPSGRAATDTRDAFATATPEASARLGVEAAASTAERTSATGAATGCIYASTCPSSLGAQCERERPADIRISDAHTVRCHLYRSSDTAA